MRAMHPVPIVFAFDCGFARYCAVSALSIAVRSNNRHRFLCFCDEILDADLQLFKLIDHKFDCETEFHPVEQSLSSNMNGFLHITRAAYFRLSAIKSLKYDRCLYLDAIH